MVSFYFPMRSGTLKLLPFPFAYLVCKPIPVPGHNTGESDNKL